MFEAIYVLLSTERDNLLFDITEQQNECFIRLYGYARKKNALQTFGSKWIKIRTTQAFP